LFGALLTRPAAATQSPLSRDHGEAMLETSDKLVDFNNGSTADVAAVHTQVPEILEQDGSAHDAFLSAAAAGELVNFPGTKHWLVRRLGDRWTLPIIDILRQGPIRFAKLKKALGPISQRMLTLSLKKLERDGLVYRISYPGSPPHVTYELTSSGMSLLEMLAPFDNWLEANFRHILEANKSFFGRH